jgi:hypothetical protein
MGVRNIVKSPHATMPRRKLPPGDAERAVSTSAREDYDDDDQAAAEEEVVCVHVPRADTEPKKSEESMVASLSAEKGRGSLTKKIHSPMRMKGRIIIKSKGV